MGGGKYLKFQYLGGSMGFGSGKASLTQPGWARWKREWGLERQLRAMIALAEDLGLVPNYHMVPHAHL